MSEDPREDWKKDVGFPINYNSASSDDDFDAQDVVFRNPRHSSKFLLQDVGDGSEADLLGTTPPRSRIRDKEKGRRNHVDSPSYQRLIPRKDVVDHPNYDYGPSLPSSRKRSSHKILRSRARDSKQDMSHEPRSDSLPSPNPMSAAVPTLVESCSRFMSLTSRPKNRETLQEAPIVDGEERWRCDGDEELPPSRVSFHKTFSLLINMGNIEKGCKRAISREEQVWQNELKDLIWLELQAKLAGRTLDQQDAYLCSQRKTVPGIITNILHYKFVNLTPCKGLAKRFSDVDHSKGAMNAEYSRQDPPTEEDIMYGCLQFDCRHCSDAIGRAMREVGSLLDTFENALSLYPSSRNMTLEHPVLATATFNNRMRALCLWFNTALHLRLKMVAMRRMLRSIRLKSMRRGHQKRSSVDSDLSRQSSETRPPCQVRFNVECSDSSNSDTSPQTTQSDLKEDADKETKEETTEVESGGSSNEAKSNGSTTPEIIISDECAGGDPYTSTESGYVSSEGAPAVSDVYDLGPVTELTHMRLLDKCHVSLYREYHREILKTQGVRRCMMFIHKMRMNLLNKVCLTLEKPEKEESSQFIEEEPEHMFEELRHKTDEPEFDGNEEQIKTYELRRHGYWSEDCVAMRLPSYRSHFLLLSAMCMEAVHDYLSFRLETRPDRPSCITIKQLIHELREGLDISSDMRAEFARHARVALCGRAAGAASKDLLLITNTFDTTMETILKQYLSYLTTMSETEHLPRSRLQAEWAFTAQLAKRVKCAAVLAPVSFSNITCNQLKGLLYKFENNFGIREQEESDDHKPDKHTIYAVCRAAQSWYAECRDAALQAAQWARALAARLARAPAPAYVQQRGEIFNGLMAIRDVIVKHIMFITERSRTVPDEMVKELVDAVHIRIRELLLQIYKLGFELHKELYRFVHVHKFSEEVRRSRPISLQPVRSPMVERRRRPETMIVHESFNLKTIHKELHRFVNEPATVRPSAPRRSINTPPGRRVRYMRSDSIVDDYENTVFDERLFDYIHNFGENPTQSSIELLLTGDQQPPSDEEVELRAPPAPPARPVSEEERGWGAAVARGVIQFARHWMQFVVERCDRGRGLRPRWASQGLEFLMLACDPRNTKHLSDEEFEELKQLMDGCISHVVGSRPAPAPAPSPRTRPRMPSPFSSTSREPLSDSDAPVFPEVPATSHKQRVIDAIERVDRERDHQLRSSKSVGHVLESAITSYEPKLRQLTFKWQRGLKIGAGTFGKVYTVVNTESGQLLAMKELSVGVGDRRALQRAANELKVLEGVLHPHLVRYYGCELHREEMLIFMELCVEGSLEALVATAGALGEQAVRRYTKQLLSAVTELHARAIAHRDIKSGNIFLTNEGHCLKLGDFGCAVKIRAHTTAPGELQGFVGTQAYMAPEVFMKTGHGRAADVWSLGCVVTEMATGKRPFSQYDSNYQIMFLVGSGGRPEIPETLSDEGRQFCLSCLTHDPDLRPKAEALTLHHFLMVKASEDDCKCEPAFLIGNPNVKK